MSDIPDEYFADKKFTREDLVKACSDLQEDLEQNAEGIALEDDNG